MWLNVGELQTTDMKMIYNKWEEKREESQKLWGIFRQVRESRIGQGQMEIC